MTCRAPSHPPHPLCSADDAAYAAAKSAETAGFKMTLLNKIEGESASAMAAREGAQVSIQRRVGEGGRGWVGAVLLVRECEGAAVGCDSTPCRGRGWLLVLFSVG